MSSPAFEEIERWFTEGGLSVSKFGLVMELYDCTLKELLEHGAPEGRLVNGNIEKSTGAAGYDILREQAFAEREKTILPIISQISSGLRALHAADLFHHDLKPANVLLRAQGDTLEVAVSDLGFLQPNYHFGTLDGRSGESMPLGTRHYRAPEQKDYFDVCEVDVTPEGGEIVLETSDGKFRDTLISSGDVLYFSKDPERVPHKVLSVQHQESKSIIKLGRPKKELKPDQRTQVLLYKLHSARTDVFGIGAILFDLLTCGNSPERFYDYLRPYDKKVTNDQIASTIQSLIGKYKQVEKSHATNAETATLFLQLRNKRFKYPSHETVRILLKCLLSGAEDSYFATHQGENRLELFNRISKELREVEKKKEAFAYNGVENPLWKGETEEGEITPSDASFAKQVNELKRNGEGHHGLRLLIGYRLFSELCETVNDFRNQEGQFFAEIAPNSLQFDPNTGRLSILGKTYSNHNEYINAVKTGDAVGLGNDDDRDNMVPPYRRYMSRPAILERITTSGDSSTQSIRLLYQDSCPFWGAFGGQMYVRLAGVGVDCEVFKIRINTSSMRIEFEDEASEVFKEEEKVAATVFREFVPVYYYLSMLGVYLHHLFFVDEDLDSGAVPQSVWYALQSSASSVSHGEVTVAILEDQGILTNVESVASRADDNNHVHVDGCLNAYLALVYSWLISRNSKIDGMSDDDLFGVVLKCRETIRKLIAIRIGVEPSRSTDLDVMRVNWIAESPEDMIDNSRGFKLTGMTSGLPKLESYLKQILQDPKSLLSVPSSGSFWAKLWGKA